MARVLIAGCGYVGTALGALLAEDGHEVFALRRSVRERPAGVSLIQADLTAIDTLRALPARLDVVFYTASADATDDRSYRGVYVDGLRYLLAALEGQTLRRVLYTSSTGVYAQQDGEWVDEISPAEPRHFSGARLLEGETLLRRSGRPATVVRLSGIYGPGRERLLERVRRGEATIPAGAPVYSNRIHRDDCAGVLRHLMSLERIEPLYLASDDEPAEMAVVLRWLAERLGVPSPPVEERAAPHERYGRTSNKRVKNARLLASGYRFRYPTFREGYAGLIAGGAAAGE
jgi:nucleoside-diphosphate-sugar epimerase